MTTVEANGINLNVITMGEHDTRRLPPVVFLHGLIMDNLSSYYYTVAPAISTRTDVVLYDMRGHGMSDRPATGYTLDDATADLLGLLDELGVAEPVVLVGNSFGGTVALHTAMTHPDRVAGLGLIEAHPVVPGWGDHLMADLEELVAGFDEPGVREFISGDGGRKLKKMASTCEQLVTDTTLAADLRAAATMTPDELGRISCPAICLYGEATDIMERAEMLAASIPGATLHIVEGCTHSVLMEAPDEIEEALSGWLLGLPGVSAGATGSATA